MSVLVNLKRSLRARVSRLVERAAAPQLDELRVRTDQNAQVALLQRDTLRSEVLRQLLHTRWLTMRRLWQIVPPAGDSPPAVQANDFEADLRRLEQLHPQLFPRWRQINMVDNPIEFAARPSSSCSVGTGMNDRAFGGFIAPYLAGRVLDVGCGPQPLPSYLTDYPVRLISGVDPLEPSTPHPFQFARGFGEFLPWPDRTFDVVINATSLDHSLSLDGVTSEIIRVLRPGGLFLVWEGFIKGSQPYRPDDPLLQPVDRFHFFHFDRPWFEAHFGQAFEIVEWLSIDESELISPPASNHFYALRLRNQL